MPLRRREKRAHFSTCRREALYLVNVGVEACKVARRGEAGTNANDDSTTKIGNLNFISLTLILDGLPHLRQRRT